MTTLSLLILLLLLLLLSVCQGLSNPNWRPVGQAPNSANITLLFALKHSPTQLTELHEVATKISTPGNQQFRKYLTLQEMNQRFAPSSQAQETVTRYLQSALRVGTSGSDGTIQPSTLALITEPAAGWIRVQDITVEEASQLLQTEFQVYEKSSTEPSPPTPPSTPPSDLPFGTSGAPSPVRHDSDAPIIRAVSGYSLPTHVADVVDFVGGVTQLPGTRFHLRTFGTEVGDTPEEALSDIDSSYIVTPKFLRLLYNISAETRGTNSEVTRQAIPSFLEQYYSESDLQAYLAQHGITPQMNISNVIGINIPSFPGGEASLDTQLMMGMAPGVKTEFWV